MTSLKIFQKIFCLLFIAGCLTSAWISAKAKGALPAALAGIRLTDHRGRVVQPASFGKGPMLLNFIFTSCPSACPVQVKELVAVHRALPADVKDKVQFLSITVDPATDKPAALASFAKRLGADVAGWRFATGQPAEITQLLKRLQVMNPQKENPQPSDHRLTLYLFNAEGIPVVTYNGAPVDKQRLVEEITQLTRLAP